MDLFPFSIQKARWGREQSSQLRGVTVSWEVREDFVSGVFLVVAFIFVSCKEENMQLSWLGWPNKSCARGHAPSREVLGVGVEVLRGRYLWGPLGSLRGLPLVTSQGTNLPPEDSTKLDVDPLSLSLASCLRCDRPRICPLHGMVSSAWRPHREWTSRLPPHWVNLGFEPLKL